MFLFQIKSLLAGREECLSGIALAAARRRRG